MASPSGSTPALLGKSNPINLADFRTKLGGMRDTAEWQLSGLEPICDLKFNEMFTEEDRMNVDTSEEGKAMEEHFKRSFSALQEKLPEVSKARLAEWAFPNVMTTLPEMCGFREPHFASVKRSRRSKFAGKVIDEDDLSMLMVRRNGVSGQRLLLCTWRDMPFDGNAQPTAQEVECTVAEVIGRMMSVHHWNAEQKLEPCVAYAMRMIRDKIAIFRMEMTPEQLEAVCEKGVIPKTKLQV